MVQIPPPPSDDAGRTPHRSSAPRTRLARLLTATGLLLALVVLASSIRPMDSTALPDLPRPNPTPYVAPGDDIITTLGHLQSRDYLVEIVSTAEGVRYDVYDAGGALIIERATPEQLEQIDPVLDTDSMHATVGIVTDDDF